MALDWLPEPCNGCPILPHFHCLLLCCSHDAEKQDENLALSLRLSMQKDNHPHHTPQFWQLSEWSLCMHCKWTGVALLHMVRNPTKARWCPITPEWGPIQPRSDWGRLHNTSRFALQGYRETRNMLLWDSICCTEPVTDHSLLRFFFFKYKGLGGGGLQ